ncbi:hypothetical protein FRAHR75_770004 [Frankia sp. Hr75.2]|nr:hypothetical protein FRAHR75_770004 [Frankia sp. Hr75.2]
MTSSAPDRPVGAKGAYYSGPLTAWGPPMRIMRIDEGGGGPLGDAVVTLVPVP